MGKTADRDCSCLVLQQAKKKKLDISTTSFGKNREEKTQMYRKCTIIPTSAREPDKIQIKIKTIEEKKKRKKKEKYNLFFIIRFLKEPVLTLMDYYCQRVPVLCMDCN